MKVTEKNVFDLAKQVCEELNKPLSLVNSGANEVEATIFVVNEAQAEAIKILLETAVSKAEIIEYNSKVDDLSRRGYSPDENAIRWQVKTDDGKATFSLSMEDKQLTKDNVAFLLNLSLKGKFDRVQNIVEELFPDGKKPNSKGKVESYADGRNVEDEIGGGLEEFIGALFTSCNIDRNSAAVELDFNVWRSDECEVGVSVSQDSLNTLIEKGNLHKTKRAQEVEDRALTNSLKTVIDADPRDISYVKSSDDTVTLTFSRKLLEKLQKFQALDSDVSGTEPRSPALERILAEGSRKTESKVSGLNNSGSVEENGVGYL